MLEDKEKKMAIGSAVQRGNSVNVYNERGVMLFSKVGELIGYTGTTVTIRRGNQKRLVRKLETSLSCFKDLS